MDGGKRKAREGEGGGQRLFGKAKWGFPLPSKGRNREK